MKDNCYKGPKTNLGIHKDLYMELLDKPVGWGTRSLKVDKPTNYAEAELLLEFVYGIKLKVEIERFTNRLKSTGWGFDNQQTQRDIAISRIEGIDHLTYIDNWPGHKTPIEKKKEIGHFTWNIGKNISSNDYSDYQFNKVTLDSSYAIESNVSQTIFGPKGSGGTDYGDNSITSFTELERIESFYLNRNSPARPEYIEYIKSLEKRNKIYRYNYLKEVCLNLCEAVY